MDLLQPEQIRDRILNHLPDAEVTVTDLTGTRDHWQVRIVSAAFAGKTPIARHRMVYAMFESELQGPIHALTLTTLTPEQAQTA